MIPCQNINIIVYYYFNSIMANWRPAVLLLLITLQCFICYRLPSTIIPHNYDIEIVTYLDEGDNHEFYFTGNVKIKVSSNNCTNY